MYLCIIILPVCQVIEGTFVGEAQQHFLKGGGGGGVYVSNREVCAFNKINVQIDLQITPA